MGWYGRVNRSGRTVVVAVFVALMLMGAASAAGESDQPLVDIGDRPFYQAVRDAKRQLKEATGLWLSLDYTIIFQASTAGLSQNDAAVGTLQFQGRWTAWDRKDGKEQGTLGFKLRHRSLYTDGGTPAFTDSLGTLWKPNDMSGTRQDQVRELWWRQRLLDGRVEYDIGKVYMKNLIDRNRYAQSGYSQFLAQPFYKNSARPIPKPGLGGSVKVTPVDWLYLLGAAADGTSVSQHSPFSTLDDQNWFYAGELGLMVDPFGLGQGAGTYRVTYWHRETEADVGSGVALSFEQPVIEGLGAFVRYGYNSTLLSPVRNALAMGVSFQKPFERTLDEAGIGFVWTDPVDGDLRNSYLFEVYYRIQLTEGIELTPDFQLIFDPSENDRDMIGVFGIRLRHVF